MLQFESQETMNLSRIVVSALDVRFDHRLQLFSLNIGTRQGTRIEQHFLYIGRKTVSVPDTIVGEFVAAQKGSLEMHPCQPGQV